MEQSFIASLPITPPNLAERLEAVVGADERQAIEVLEALVQEILELLQLHMPEANISALGYPPGARQRPWRVGGLAESSAEPITVLVRSRQPVLAQEFADPYVPPPVVSKLVMAVDPNRLIADLLQRTSTRGVAFDDGSHDFLQAKFFEGIARSQRHGFTGDATTPPRFIANDYSRRGVSAAPVDLGNTGPADVLPLRENAPGNIGVTP